MLLAIDVGNTQTVFGLRSGENWLGQWRVATEPERTADELAVLVDRLLALRDHSIEDVKAACLSSTVPVLVREYKTFAESYLNTQVLIVGPGVRTGIPILVDDPREVGPDRIANSVAALETYGAPCVVVDFGTATNFDVVSQEGEYIGGAIAPGIETSMEALFSRAARLVKVDFVAPPNPVGRNTVHALQSGFVFGFAGQIDGVVGRIRSEIGQEARVISTGGLAGLVAPYSDTIELVDANLTLEGLRIVWDRNQEV